MFNSADATKPIPAVIKLIDGSSQHGNIIIAMNSDLPRTLNGDGKFLEFELANGQKSYICKTSIAETLPTDIPKVKKLAAVSDSDKEFNPFQVLKVAPGSTIQDIQRAYHDRAKMYHPDRFANTEMPTEMTKYAENMSRLINAAFQILNAQAEAGGDTAPTQTPAPQAVNL